MLGREVDAPAGNGAAVGSTGPGGDGAAPAREAQHPHPGRVLGGHQRLAPAVLAEREEDGRVGDAGPVVGDGHREGAALGAGDDDAHPRGIGPAGVLQELGEDVAERRGEGPRDALQGAVVDARANTSSVVHVRFLRDGCGMRKRSAPRAGRCRAGR